VSRSDEVRARQQGANALSAGDVWMAFLSQLGEHLTHPWHQVGPCVYCEPCSRRLYQGEVLTDQEKAEIQEALAESGGTT
jgi:hypothetical protein